MAASEPEDVGHRVPPGRLVCQELGRQQGAAGVAVPAVPLVDELQRLAEGAEDDRVLADVVPGPDGVHPDLGLRPLADHPLPPVDQLGDVHRLLDDPGEVHGPPARRVLLTRWCPSPISPSNPSPLRATAVSLTSLNRRFTTRLMLGEKSTAVAWAAASISVR